MSQGQLGQVELSVNRKKHLQQKKAERQHQWDSLSQKIVALRQDIAVETRAEERLRLQRQIDQAEAERAKLEQELDNLEQRLAASAHIHNLSAEPSSVVAETAFPTDDNLIPDCPYRGLFPFRSEHAHLFFGRDDFAKKLVQAVESRSFIAVLGASGSGKSSVVFAGLVPELDATGQWLFSIFRPADDPILGLASALVPLYETTLSKTEQLLAMRKLATNLRRGDLPLSDVVNLIHQTKPDHRLLIIVDQFEELYTLCRDQNIRQQFLDILLKSVGPVQGSSFRLVLTLRADFLGQASLYPPFAKALDSEGATKVLGPMTRSEMTEAIEKPARLHDVHFETKLLDRILDDVGKEEGSLPLLEFALTQLWEQQVNGQLTHIAYEVIGRVEGALTNYADKVYTNLNQAEQEQARRVMIRMIHLGEGTEENTRRLVAGNELRDTHWPLVRKLADTRLLVTNRDVTGLETVEIVHETLIRGWPRLRNWIDEDRNNLQIHRRLTQNAKEWDQHGRDWSYRYRGERLGEALEWAQTHPEELSSLEQEFLRKSEGTRRWEKVSKHFALYSPIYVLTVGVVLFRLNPDYIGRMIFSCERRGVPDDLCSQPCGWLMIPVIIVPLIMAHFGVRGSIALFKEKWMAAFWLIFAFVILPALGLCVLGPAILLIMETPGIGE